MTYSSDTQAATEAIESAGMDPRHARVIAAQFLAVSCAGDAVTHPELEAALATFKTALIDRIAESEHRLMGRIDRIAENQSGLVNRIAGSDRRHGAQLWRLFGGIVAVAGLAVSAIKYLP